MQYHSYIFFDSEPSCNTFSTSELESAKQAFSQCIENCADVEVHAYATLGMKAGSRIMLDMEASSPVDIQKLLRDLMHTSLGFHLRISHTLLGLTRGSQYRSGPQKEADPKAPHQYLVVYPFTKTIEWHLLPKEERQKMMTEHIVVGRKYSQRISQLLLYSYGIDDQEFIVSYQTDSLEEFQTLVMELRATEGRRYTQSDTPIFTCIHMPLAEALNML